MIAALAPPSAPAAQPIWLEQPTAAEIALNRSKYSPTAGQDTILQMSCYVQSDGRLTLCAGDPALRRLASRYRLDRASFDASRVIVTLPAPPLFDRPGLPDRQPTRAELITIGGSGDVRLLCKVSETGSTGDCEAAEDAAGANPPGAAELAAAKAAAALYHFRAATLSGRPTAFYAPLKITLGDPDRLRAPQWVSKPSYYDLSRGYPKAADRYGVEGVALMRCRISLQGQAKDCRIEEEAPIGVGFGAAALTTADKFRMSPETRDGKAVDTGEVEIPVFFRSSGLSLPSAYNRLLPWVPLTAAPTQDQVLAAGAGTGSLAGGATLLCNIAATGALTNCIGLGTKQNALFDAAALSLTPLFRADMSALPILTAIPLSTRISFTFPAPAASPPERRYVKSFQWLRRFGPEDVVAAYPAQAVSAGVLNGAAALDCHIAAGGRLEACVVDSETPQHLGFGESAAKIATVMQANAWTQQGEPTAGARVRFPLKFVYTADDSTAAPKGR